MWCPGHLPAPLGTKGSAGSMGGHIKNFQPCKTCICLLSSDFFQSQINAFSVALLCIGQVCLKKKNLPATWQVLTCGSTGVVGVFVFIASRPVSPGPRLRPCGLHIVLTTPCSGHAAAWAVFWLCLVANYVYSQGRNCLYLPARVCIV